MSSGERKIYRLSLRGNRRLNHAIHMAAITQIRHAHSEGRAYYDKKLAEGKTPKEACAPSNGAPATPSTGGGALMPAAPPSDLRRSRAREGKRGTALTPARPAHTPDAGSSAQPLSDLSPPYAPAPVTQPEERSSRASNAPNHLTQRGFVMPRSLGPGDY